jgi:hypothetical protein
LLARLGSRLPLIVFVGFFDDGRLAFHVGSLLDDFAKGHGLTARCGGASVPALTEDSLRAANQS